MEPLISIVIPVYNVEPYLRRCLDSVLAQTYGHFEALLVDDGSTDGSGRICEEYAAKDGRFKVFHKENGGLSDARNFGVVRAAGDLVSFIDSDDYITPDYLEVLWSLMEKFDCGISSASCIQLPEGKSPARKSGPFKEEKLGAGPALEKIYCGSTGVWARLYKKPLLLEYPFPVGRLYEDIAALYKLIDAAGGAAFTDRQIYIWVQREGSITHSGISERQLDVFWALEELYAFTAEHYPASCDAASLRFIADTIFFLKLVFRYCGEADSRKYFALAREKALPHIQAAIRRPEATLPQKLAMLGLRAGYLPYKAMYELREKQRTAADRRN